MKTLLFLFASSLFLMPTNVPKFIPQDYIEIAYIGIQQKPEHQTFIVKKELEFETMVARLAAKGAQPQPKENVELEWKASYNTIVTNETTFSTIKLFIDQNQKYFASEPEGELIRRYAITVNGKTYIVIAKSQKDMFHDLAEFLKKRNCDDLVIKELGNYPRVPYHPQ